MANKIKLRRSLTTGAKMPAGTAADAGEVGVNIPDGKIYMRNASGAPVLVADRIKDHSAAQAYDAGDFVVRDGVFMRARVNMAAGAFNAANWDAVGGGNAQGAILQLPDSALRNTINLLGKPTYKGLVIRGDSAQTANLLEVPGTTAGDTRGALVDPTGFPVDRFAVNIFRVVQASHPFLYRGQPVAFDGGQWVPADASNPARVALAVVEQRIDDNTFVLRTGGRMEQLQAAAFSGGSMVAGRVYYVSGTEPGKLTSTPSTIRPDPALIYLGGNAAIVVAGTGTAETDYVSVSGDTMSGPLTMGGQNEVRFDTSATALYKQTASPSLLVKIAGAVAGRVDEAGAEAGYGATLMTRDKGDARYLRMDGTAAGTAIALASTSPRIDFTETDAALNAKRWRMVADAGRMYVGTINDDGTGLTERYRFTRDASLGTDSAIVTRGAGDDRYLTLSGGTMTGALTLPSANPTADRHAAHKGYVDAQVGGRLTQSAADGRYALRSITLSGGTGITSTIGNLTASRSISLDLGYTDDRYLRANAGKGTNASYQGRLNIYAQHSSDLALRVYGTDDVVAFTVTSAGTVGMPGNLNAGGAVRGGDLVMRHNGSNAFLENEGSGHVHIGAAGDAGPYARYDRDGGLGAPSSIVTRSTGDARYVNGDTAWNGIGSTVMAQYIGSGSPATGAVVEGTDLRVSSADGDTGGNALTGRWMLCGRIATPGTVSRVSNFRRVS